jgi:hypothetical protein
VPPQQRASKTVRWDSIRPVPSFFSPSYLQPPSSNLCLFIHLRTLLRHGALPSPLPSITCALFSSPRRGWGSHSSPNLQTFQRATFKRSYLPWYPLSRSSGGRSPLATRHSPLSHFLPWCPASSAAPCARRSRPCRGDSSIFHGSRNTVHCLRPYTDSSTLFRLPTVNRRSRSYRGGQLSTLLPSVCFQHVTNCPICKSFVLKTIQQYRGWVGVIAPMPLKKGGNARVRPRQYET